MTNNPEGVNIAYHNGNQKIDRTSDFAMLVVTQKLLQYREWYRVVRVACCTDYFRTEGGTWVVREIKCYHGTGTENQNRESVYIQSMYIQQHPLCVV